MFKRLNRAHKYLCAPVNVKMKNKGYTLIEMLVAVAVFSIIIGAISGLFISVIRGQGRILATQKVLDETSYVMEYISRALRMAKKELGQGCLSVYGKNYELTANGINFIDYHGICTKFSLNTTTGQLEKTAEGATLPITSADLKVNSFVVKLLGADQPPTDYRQPRTTIFLEAESKKSFFGSPPKIQIQTSISQRNLDIQY